MGFFFFFKRHKSVPRFRLINIYIYMYLLDKINMPSFLVSFVFPRMYVHAYVNKYLCAPFFLSLIATTIRT